MSSHEIRLRGPWQVSLDTRGDNASQGETVQKVSLPGPLPANLREAVTTGGANRIVCVRSFGCPTGLMSNQDVELRIESVQCTASIVINGVAVGKFGPGQEFCTSIRSILQPRNQLEIQLDIPAELEQVLSLFERDCVGLVSLAIDNE